MMSNQINQPLAVSGMTGILEQFVYSLRAEVDFRAILAQDVFHLLLRNAYHFRSLSQADLTCLVSIRRFFWNDCDLIALAFLLKQEHHKLLNEL